MADDFDAYLERLRAARATAERNRREPVVGYETRWGRATLEDSSGQLMYRVEQPNGDWEEFDLAEDPDARPIRAPAGRAPTPRERVRQDDPMRVGPRGERSFAQRNSDSYRFNASYRDTQYRDVRRVARAGAPSWASELQLRDGATLAEVEANYAADEAGRYRTQIERRRALIEEEQLLQYYDPPDSVSDWVADLAGGFGAYAIDPANYLGFGRTILQRALTQGGIQGAQDVVVQQADRSDGAARAWTPLDQQRLGDELAEIYRTRGAAAFDAELETLDWDRIDRETGAAAPFDVTRVAMVAGAGAAFSGGLEAGGSAIARSFGWRPSEDNGLIERALRRGITEPYLRRVTRARVASLGDPELDRLVRLPNGEIDPRAVPLARVFAETEPWLRELTPSVDAAARALSPRERANAYAETFVRLSDASARGSDLTHFADALGAARAAGELPDLKALATIETMAREMAAGRLGPDEIGATARTLTRLAERIDPAIAGMRRARATMRRGLAQADERVWVERVAREAEAGVGEAAIPPRRFVTDDERVEIDAYVEQLINGQAATGPSLAQWVIARGGIKDEGGDVLHAIGGHKARPGLVRRNGGRGADDLIVAATEAGYFPELRGETNLDGRTLIDALGEEVNGRAKRFAGADDELEARRQAEALADWFSRNEIDPTLIGDGAEARLKGQIAERIYDATYAEPAGGPVEPDAGGKRPSPPGWGARRGQKAGMGAGGAAVSPTARMKAFRTPIPRQTFFRRQARSAKRRGLSTYIDDVIARAYTAVIESQHPIVMAQKSLVAEIERVAGVATSLKPDENAALLARLSRDGYSPGHLDLMHGVRPYRQLDVQASPSFRESIETATGGKEWTDARIGDFEDYLIARRAVKAWDRYAAGELERPPHAMGKGDLADAIRGFEADNPTFRDGADKLYRFLTAHWQKKRDAGLITDEQYQAGIARNEDYVPFQRDMDDSGADPSRGGEPPGAPATSGGRTNKRKAFERFRGSDRKILSPLSTIMADVYATADRIARNESYRSFVDLAARAGDFGESIAKKVPRPMKRTNIDVAEEAERAAIAAGASVQDAKALSGSIDSLLNGETSRVIYRAGDVVEGGRKIIYVWRDGEREAWELTDPEFANDLFQAMTGLTQEGRDLFLDALAIPTQAIRTAITAWPGFQFANIVRDSLSAWMVTDVKFKPGESITHGIGEVLRQGDLAKLYNAVGTQGGGVVRSAMPRSRIERDLPALRGKVLQVSTFTPMALWRAFETATELSENATRIQLFARSIERAKKDGLDDYNAALWAAYESRDYLDFQRTGSRMLNARRAVLFLNASLQGLDRTLRTMTAEGDMKTMMAPLENVLAGRKTWAGLTVNERYLAGRAWKYLAKLMLVGTMGLSLAALYADDEDYQYGFSDYMKNNYWLVRAGNTWISIPKPFEHAVMSNIMERSYEATYGNDPLAWGRLVRGLGETYLPPSEITAAAVPMQLMMNRTATGAPIVPEGLEDLDPHLQYTAMTSALSVRFAQGLAENTGIEMSPAQLDHVFGGVGGEFFRAPARLLDTDAPAMNPSDVPVLSRFLREPGRGGTPVRVAFYDSAMRQSGALNRAAGTLNEHIDRGDMGAVEKFLTERAPWERVYAVLQAGGDTDSRRLHPMSRARNVVTEIGRIRRELNGARPLASETLFLPDLTPRQRRDALEALDDLSAAEMQAALVMAEAPGFAGRPIMDVEARYERLEAIAPTVATLIRARLISGANKAIDFDTVRQVWPEARRRIEANGFRAELSDLAARGSADFGEATMRALELEAAGGRVERRSRRQRQAEEAEQLERIGAP